MPDPTPTTQSRPSAAVVIPTAGRPAYLDVALASLVPQARAAGADVLVVDDGTDPETTAVAERHGIRHVHTLPPGGLNAARNLGLDATVPAELVVYVDDDVRVDDGWLDALLCAAATEPDDVGAFTGPIRARFEDHRFRMCGREDPPITTTDHGPDPAHVVHAWGANMAIRRSAVARAGRFDEGGHLENAGDEQEWQDRLLATGARIGYVPDAGLEHRRAGDDARLRSLCRSAFARGRASRRFDVYKRTSPSVMRELRVLAGCVWHGPRRACMNGPVLAAHTAGRVREALSEMHPRHDAPPARGVEDFLAGTSGVVGGRRAVLRRIADARLDRRVARRLRILRSEALARPTRRVLAIGVESPDQPTTMAATHAELARSHHDVEVRTRVSAGAGKFENLNALLAEAPIDRFDWLVVVDDDVDLPAGFLDVFLLCCEAGGLRIAQPAQRLASHAAWEITRRRDAKADWRETTFVEIGPVTAFHRDTFGVLLPFPDVRMGWGLDAHWSALARTNGWPIGIVDAAAVGHTLRTVADTYPREEAIAEARAFLAGRPYVRRDEVRTLGLRRYDSASGGGAG